MLTQDIKVPFDITGYNSISSAILAQLVGGLKSNDDRGICLYTTDVGGVPVVPDGRDVGVPEFQRYLWVRQSPLTVVVYAWNKNIPNNDITLLNWHPITGLIGPQEVQTVNLADGAVTDQKVTNIDYSKLLNTPDLTAIIPPDASISSAKIQTNAVTAVKIPDASITPSKLANGAGALQLVRINNAGTAFEFVTPPTSFGIVNPAVGDANKLLGINGAGDNFSYVARYISGDVVQRIALSDTTEIVAADGVTALTNATTRPTNAMGFDIPALALTITPKFNNSKIFINTTVNVYVPTGNSTFVALSIFSATVGANAMATGFNSIVAGVIAGQVSVGLVHQPGSVAPITYNIRLSSLMTGAGNNLVYNKATYAGGYLTSFASAVEIAA